MQGIAHWYRSTESPSRTSTRLACLHVQLTIHKSEVDKCRIAWQQADDMDKARAAFDELWGSMHGAMQRTSGSVEQRAPKAYSIYDSGTVLKRSRSADQCAHKFVSRKDGEPVRQPTNNTMRRQVQCEGNGAKLLHCIQELSDHPCEETSRDTASNLVSEVLFKFYQDKSGNLRSAFEVESNLQAILAIREQVIDKLAVTASQYDYHGWNVMAWRQWLGDTPLAHEQMAFAVR